MKGCKPRLRTIDKSDLELSKNSTYTPKDSYALNNLQKIINYNVKNNCLNTSDLVENICSAYTKPYHTERRQSKDTDNNSLDNSCYRRLKVSAKENNTQNTTQNTFRISNQTNKKIYFKNNLTLNRSSSKDQDLIAESFVVYGKYDNKTNKYNRYQQFSESPQPTIHNHTCIRQQSLEICDDKYLHDLRDKWIQKKRQIIQR